MTQLADNLEDVTLRGLALWGMTILDPCCLVFEEFAKASSEPEDDVSEQESANILRSVEKLLTLTRDAMIALYADGISADIYHKIVAAHTLAPSFDLWERPLSTAAKAIYVFMTAADMVWGELVPSEMGGTTENVDETFIQKELREFVRVIPFVAAVRGIDPLFEFDDANDKIKQILAYGKRTVVDPQGLELPKPVIRSVLRGCQFFSYGMVAR